MIHKRKLFRQIPWKRWEAARARKGEKERQPKRGSECERGREKCVGQQGRWTCVRISDGSRVPMLRIRSINVIVDIFVQFRTYHNKGFLTISTSTWMCVCVLIAQHFLSIHTATGRIQKVQINAKKDLPKNFLNFSSAVLFFPIYFTRSYRHRINGSSMWCDVNFKLCIICSVHLATGERASKNGSCLQQQQQ